MAKGTYITVEENKKFLDRLEEARKMEDRAAAHRAADQVFVEAMTKLGFTEIVDAWKNVPKWYA